jgi:hypothetical protein
METSKEERGKSSFELGETQESAPCRKPNGHVKPSRPAVLIYYALRAT